MGIDTYGSVFKKYKETGEFDPKEIYPYLTEGIGEDILPKNVDFSLIDHFVKVTDKDSAIMTRRLAREEGMFVGWSSGSAVFGALEWARQHLQQDDMMVIILPDHGTRYLNKVYNDEWMRAHGFLESQEFATAADIIRNQNGHSKLRTIDQDATVAEAVKLMDAQGISQLPVISDDSFVGSLTDKILLSKILNEPNLKQRKVKDIMDAPFQFVGLNNTLDVLSTVLKDSHQAVMVRDENNEPHIITQHDILRTLMEK